MRKILSLAFALVLGAGLLTGCGASTDDKTITVGASPSPHAEILNNVVKKVLKKQGYTLKVKEFQDYVLPNEALNNGEIDANYFQHEPYLKDFNKKKKTKLTAVVKVHFEPLGIYAGKTKSLADLANGATIAIPNDTTNEARALQLLQAQGLITLKDGVGLTATILDIKDNPKNLNFKEVVAAQIARSLADVDLGVINGNYAIAAKLVVADALATEAADSSAAKEYANVIAVKKGNEKTAKTKALIKAITSNEVKEYINNKYKGSVVAVF